VQSGSVDYIGSDTWQAADGSRSLDMSGHDAGSIFQNVSGFTVGQQYRLSFDLASNVEGGPTIKSLQAQIGSTAQTFTFDGTGFSYANMGWSLRTLDFIANNTTMGLTFTSLDSGSAGPALDNVSITIVPEPAGASMLCVYALLTLGWMARRPRRVRAETAHRRYLA
jgi:choice-of-anchor C domain-containing protein